MTFELNPSLPSFDPSFQPRTATAVTVVPVSRPTPTVTHQAPPNLFASPAADPTTATPPVAAPATTAADLSKPPIGFEGLTYTSTTDAPLVHSDEYPPYVRGGIGTPPEVGQLHEAGGANFLNPRWAAMVADHAQRNGGLGNEQDGFLAYSEQGFVRFYNPNLSAEQNRRLAAISLQTGWPIEKMPSRADEAGPDTDQWVGKFFERFDREFANFQADPLGYKMTVRDGKKRFVLDFNEQVGAFVSFNYKKHGGLRGFVENNLKVLAPVLDGISLVGSFIPGVGQLAAGIAQGVKAVAGAIATGSIKAKQILGAITGFLLPKGTPLTTNQAVLLGGANAVAGAIDNGKFSAQDLLGAVTPLLPELGPNADKILKQGLGALAGAIDGKKLRPQDFLGLVEPVLSEIGKQFDGSPLGALEDLVLGVQGGSVTTGRAESTLRQFIDTIRGDRDLRNLLKGGLEVVVDAVRGKKIDPMRLFETLTPFVLAQLGKLGGAETPAVDPAA